jgi:hypothetical protein
MIYGGKPFDLDVSSTREEWRDVFQIVLVAVAISVLLHACISRWLLACLVSAVSFSTALVVHAYFLDGYLDPFFMIAGVVGALVGFAIAAIVGIPFLAYRTRSKPRGVA